MEGRTVEVKWFESHDNLIELAHWLLVDGWFTYPIDMLRYFEKPWKWTPEWDEMRANLPSEDTDPTCEKCGGYGWVDTDAAVPNSTMYTITCPDCQGSGMDQPTEEQLGLDDPEAWALREPSDGEPFLEEDVEERPSDLIWKEELIVP